jgi:hypothetical protein
MNFKIIVQPVANLLSGIERTALLRVGEMGEVQVRQIIEHFAQNHVSAEVRAEAQAQLDILNQE